MKESRKKEQATTALHISIERNLIGHERVQLAPLAVQTWYSMPLRNTDPHVIQHTSNETLPQNLFDVVYDVHVPCVPLLLCFGNVDKLIAIL